MVAFASRLPPVAAVDTTTASEGSALSLCSANLPNPWSQPKDPTAQHASR